MFDGNTVTHILARDLTGAIGNANGIPWKCSADMKHFRKHTTGKVCIVGRKTYESFPKELPNRHFVILTKDQNYSDKLKDRHKSYSVTSLSEALHVADKLITKHNLPSEIMVIGGAELYRATAPYTDKLLLSTIFTEVEEADTYVDFNAFQYSWNLEVEAFLFKVDKE